MLLRARHYATGEPTDVEYAGGAIVRVARAGIIPADRVAGWVAPALFDLQINGCLGIGFNSSALTGDQVRAVVDECRRHGIGGLLPTLVTGSFYTLSPRFFPLPKALGHRPS